MQLADRIRQFVLRKYFEPAIRAGISETNIRAGDVHREMGLVNRMPAVCGALDTKVLQDRFGVELVRRGGPRQGANATFCYRLAGEKTKNRVLGPQAIETVRNRGIDTPNTNTVYLVSCVSKKRANRAPARDLYLSDWFSKARNLIEAKGVPWFILSAEHGLVAPDDLLEPYEKTLNTMLASDRRRWAEKVIRQISEKMPKAKSVTFLAGKRYREFLENYLRNQGVSVEIPMEGLRIGEQLAWLSAQMKDG